MQLELDARYNAVAKFIVEASGGTLPPPIQAHLCSFGTVLVCGYIEQAVQIVIMERLSSRAQPRVLNFVRSHLRRGRNMDAKGVAELLQRFDPTWYREFDRLAKSNDAMRDGVSSCYDMRNSIAHGGAATVTPSRLTDLLAAAKEMVDLVVSTTK